MVAAERALEEDDPDQAHEHTKVARRFAARIGVVREAAGIVAYRAGHFSEALSDLRAARRMTGSDAYLAVMADCERGLGRPERALDLVRSPEAERLDRAGRIELSIVESGARRDLGQKDAAVITLQRLPELRDTQAKPWSARLAFAYADALADAGHQEAATDWFARAMAFDEDGETDAAERYAELTGAVIEDVEEDFDDEDDFEDAGRADQADEVDEDVDEDAAFAEAGDLLDDLEPADDQTADAEPADQQDDTAGQGDDTAVQQDIDDQDRSADLQDIDDDQDESADLQDVDDDQDESADPQDVHDEQDGSAGQAESAPEPVESASEQDATGEVAPETSEPGDILDGSEDAESESGDVLDGPGTTRSDASVSKARLPEVPITLGISPAFIEPDFGDILDQSDEPAEDAPKRDSKRED
ncbi:hypothetical protein AB0F17_53695 [Nonomuraea sp. NPDC026600]|uniref:hypothetical protein n=1 Tax=Nonomuraea sp. NPDC026600 TaxID=3155363 RepID=UPI0033D177AF